MKFLNLDVTESKNEFKMISSPRESSWHMKFGSLGSYFFLNNMAVVMLKIEMQEGYPCHTEMNVLYVF